MINVVTTSALGKLLFQHGSFENFPNANDYLSLQKWLEKKQARLNPTFPENEDQQLRNHYRLEANLEISQEDLDNLLKMPGIDGAFKKPADDLPV